MTRHPPDAATESLDDPSRRHLDIRPVLAVAGAATLGSFVRIATWPSVTGLDGWSYLMWGESILRFERPLYDASLTTPKPVATLLGTIGALFPGRIGIHLLLGVALASLLALVCACGYRWRGWGAVLISFVALAIGVDLSDILAVPFIDVVTAALVVGGVLGSGWRRVGLFVLAGLVRPEAWLLTGLAAAAATTGPRWKRAAIGIAGMAAAPLLWMGFDLLTAGDPLATVHWTETAREYRASQGVPVVGTSIVDLPGAFGNAFFRHPLIALVTVAGVVGLVRLARSGRDPAARWPLIVFIVWIGALALELTAGLSLLSRYLIPAMAMLAIGCGALIPVLRPGRVASFIGAATVCALAGYLALGLRLDPIRLGGAARNSQIAAGESAIRAGLDCGRLGVTGNWYARGFIATLSVATDTDPRRFVQLFPADGSDTIEAPSDVGAIYRFHWLGGDLPAGWARYRLPRGRMGFRPGCDAPESLEGRRLGIGVEVRGDGGSPVG